MIKTTIIGLASVAALSLGTLTPALANYRHSIEQPDAPPPEDLQHAQSASSKDWTHCAEAYRPRP